jgi:hypothetical protein
VHDLLQRAELYTPQSDDKSLESSVWVLITADPDTRDSPGYRSEYQEDVIGGRIQCAFGRSEH